MRLVPYLLYTEHWIVCLKKIRSMGRYVVPHDHSVAESATEQDAFDGRKKDDVEMVENVPVAPSMV